MEHRERISSMVVALVAATLACAQWSFTVDPTFQTQITQQNVNDLLLNEDGTVIASGVMGFPSEIGDKRLVRLLPNGVRDDTFYNSGLGGSKLVRWQDRFYAGPYPRRILASGQQDPSFIGLNLGPYFSSLQFGDYHVYPDGRIVISGSHQLSDSIRGFQGRYQLIWFTDQGYLDTTRTHRTGGNCAVYRLKELPNGQFICSGTCGQFEGRPVDWIFRVHADGTPDTTFRTGVYIGSAFDFLPLSDGRVYAAGNFRRTQAPQDTLRLVRFLPNGDLDPTFNIPQFTNGSIPGIFGSYGVSVRKWLDGNLMVSGKFQFVNGQPRGGICLLDTNGAVLPAFANSGVGPFEYGGLTYASIERFAYDTANAQLYICGAYNGYTDGVTNATEQRFVTRLHVQQIITGQRPVASAQEGLRVYPNPASGMVTVVLGPVPPKAQLVLRDAVGREHLRVPMPGSSIVLDLDALANGIYLAEVWSRGTRVQIERLVVE
ncbi:MAG: T9SS type A sorting domain-containing protein [Flavobacteriales bacterium]